MSHLSAASFHFLSVFFFLFLVNFVIEELGREELRRQKHRPRAAAASDAGGESRTGSDAAEASDAAGTLPVETPRVRHR